MIEYLDLKRITALHREELQASISAVVDSGRYLQGGHVARFEAEYAAYIGTKHCVTCGSGLDALTLMMRAYIECGHLKAGDEVLVPANTYIATILSISESGLIPVLVEPDRHTLQIDWQRAKAAITPRTRAMMIVHLYGRCAYNDDIDRLCKQHGLLLFEDNAQAHGCLWGNRRTGSLAHAAAHSFYPGKNLGAMGDGGAVTTNDEQIADMVRTLANYGSPRKYVFSYRGKNSRLDELQAAILSVKLQYLDSENATRRRIAKYYIDNIHQDTIEIPTSDVQHSVWHIFPILCSCREKLQEYLSKEGIGTMIHYPIPPHKQTCYPEWNTLSFPITEHIHQCELSLPCHQAMSPEDAEQVVKAINHFK